MKKRFSLLPIMKIREYEEFVQRQEFLKASEQDRKLAAEYQKIDESQKKAYSNIKEIQNRDDFNAFKDIHGFISLCEKRKQEISSKRKIIKPEIDRARDKYAQAHKDAEVLRIAYSKQRQQYLKEARKKSMEELQEKSIWLNK